MSRSQRGEGGIICEYEGCGKRCKNRGGLTRHQKRKHREGQKVMFKCDRCGKEMATEGARASHVRSCTGGGSGEGNRRICGRCGASVSSSNYARHQRTCGGGDEGGGRGAGGSRGAGNSREVRGPTSLCTVCGKRITVRNMARHMDSQHRVWDPRGGPRP